MTDFNQADEITRPIRVVPETKTQEQTAQSQNPMETSGEQVPEWLIEFVSQSEPEKFEELPEKQILPDPSDQDDQDEATSPVLIKSSGWQPAPIAPEAGPDSPKASHDGLAPDLAKLLKDLKNNNYAQFVKNIEAHTLNQADRALLRTKMRPHLTLSKEAEPLWDIYDSLIIKESE